MRIAKGIAAIVFWFGLWIVIPAALLYPVMRWTILHTNISQKWMADLYITGIGVLFLPTAFLVDFVYRHFREAGKPPEPHQNPN